MITHLSLFSGIGGLDLAAEMAGITTVGQCEWADYPTKVLEKHWPDVPKWRDIRTLTKESFYERTGLRTVDIVSGGFPCQPFSVAGKRRSTEDDRYLWPEMLRVLREIRPRWVVGENVAGIINLALDTVLSDLENEGYSTEAVVIPACSVNAPHRRDRVAILAYSMCDRSETGASDSKRGQEGKPAEFIDSRKNVAHAQSWGEQRQQSVRCEAWRSGSRGSIFSAEWWATEPELGRVAYGIPHRVDRLRCLGNAVVPQQFYPFFMAIAETYK